MWFARLLLMFFLVAYSVNAMEEAGSSPSTQRNPIEESLSRGMAKLEVNSNVGVDTRLTNQMAKLHLSPAGEAMPSASRRDQASASRKKKKRKETLESSKPVKFKRTKAGRTAQAFRDLQDKQRASQPVNFEPTRSFYELLRAKEADRIQVMRADLRQVEREKLKASSEMKQLEEEVGSAMQSQDPDLKAIKSAIRQAKDLKEFLLQVEKLESWGERQLTRLSKKDRRLASMTVPKQEEGRDGPNVS